MSNQIRFAGPDDAAIILGFVRELAEYERAPDAVEATESDYRRQLAMTPAPFECLLIEDEGAPAGMALFFHNYSTWKGKRGLWLEDLYVRPDHRGRGLGGKLMRRLAQIALERDCARMEWWVLDWNEPALEVYRHLGAKPQSDWTVYRLTSDALVRVATK
ncbi:MAG: GNAT family N-acetyltransferase [Planctomycetes bacterium]|nr:GNAT family N-acetyltransferase [Planctomycetota bacterium]